MINFADVGFATKRNRYLIDRVADDVVEFEEEKLQNRRKPRMTLSMHLTKAESKPKVHLRLNPPEEASQRKPQPKSIRVRRKTTLSVIWYGPYTENVI